MLQYALLGLALGAIYAIASAGLVVTYESTGVLNFAFGAMALVIARFYYWINSQEHWNTIVSGLISMLVIAPLLGIVLYALVFRFIRDKSVLVKLVATIGVFVALPQLTNLVFTNQTINAAPGLAFPPHDYHFLGAVVDTNQLITYGFLIVILVLGTVVLRATSAGLQVRAVVDSEAMATLSGSNPGRVAFGVWAVSSTLAGIAGILVAPTVGLNIEGMTGLMIAAFAAVVGARLRSLPVAVAVAMTMGVVTDILLDPKIIHTNSHWIAGINISTDINIGIPYVVLFLFLVIHAVRQGSVVERSSVGGPLDQAIRPAVDVTLRARDIVAARSRRSQVLSALPLVAVAVLPLVFRENPFWMGLVATGACWAIFFLTFTLVTGEGGMLWLSQIIFAGIGAVTAGQFAPHMPVLLAVLLGGIVAAVIGAVIGLLTLRLGDLYVALGTLTFGLAVESLVFTVNRFSQGVAGVPVNRPPFAQSDFAFAYLALAVFGVFALLTVNLRRSTSGLALRAVRDSENASRTLGLSVRSVKVMVGTLGAFVAAIGGGFLALDLYSAAPGIGGIFETISGLALLAVVVAIGVRSITAAALAGMAYAVLPGISQSTTWTTWQPVLFGLGAVLVVRYPEGAALQLGRQVRDLIERAMPGSGSSPDSTNESEVGLVGESVSHADDPAQFPRPAAGVAVETGR